MIYVLIALAVVVISTFAYSLYGVLTDDLVVWEQMDWTPTWPYGFRHEPEPNVDPDIVTHHLLENNNEEPTN